MLQLLYPFYSRWEGSRIQHLNRILKNVQTAPKPINWKNSNSSINTKNSSNNAEDKSSKNHTELQPGLCSSSVSWIFPSSKAPRWEVLE